MQFCTKCGSPQKGTDLFCSGCGNKFAAEAPNNVGTSDDSLAKVKDTLAPGGCQNGHENPQGTKFCSQCNSPIRFGDARLTPDQREWREDYAKEVLQPYYSNDEAKAARLKVVRPLYQQLQVKMYVRGFTAATIDAGVPSESIIRVVELCRLNLNQAMVALDFAIDSRTTLEHAAEVLRASGWEPTTAWNTLIEMGLAGSFDWPEPKSQVTLPCVNGHPNIPKHLFCPECDKPVPQQASAISAEDRAKYVEIVKTAMTKMNRKPSGKTLGEMGQLSGQLLLLEDETGFDSAWRTQHGANGGEDLGYTLQPRIIEWGILTLWNMHVGNAKVTLDKAIEWRCRWFDAAYYLRLNGGYNEPAWNELIKDGRAGTFKWEKDASGGPVVSKQSVPGPPTQQAPQSPSRPGQLRCAQCGAVGTVTAKEMKQKQGISGTKATAAVLTMGVSVLGTGLSRKAKVTQLHCSACGITWLA